MVMQVRVLPWAPIMIDMTTDITIIRNKPYQGKAEVSAQTSAGMEWMVMNLDIHNGFTTITIDVEWVEEFEEMMGARGLSVLVC